MSEHQWRSGGSITPPERQLLDLIREGKVDAEIAVRLGISNAEAKARTARLASKLGVRDKAGLRELASRQAGLSSGATTRTEIEQLRGGLLRWKLTSAALAVAVVAALGVGWLLARGDGDQDPGAAVRDEPTATTTLAPLATPSPTPSPVTLLMHGREMQLLGRPFDARGGAFTGLETEERETLLVARLSQPSVFRQGNFTAPLLYVGGGPASAFFSLQFPGRDVYFELSAAPGTEFIFGDDDSIGLFSRAGAGPVVTMWARAPEGPAYYHLELDTGGNLYISRDPVSGDEPVAFDTGERLTIDTLQVLATSGLADHWTLCGDRETCAGILRGDITTTTPGILKCDEASGILTLKTQPLKTLYFKWQGPGSLPCREPEITLFPGQAIDYEGIYEVSATDADGSALSVVITRDGAVYVGDVTHEFGCPCRIGS